MKTLAQLRDSLSQNIGDYLHSTVSTALAASTSIVDTSLIQYTTRDDYFKSRWALITSLANAGVSRRILDYSTGANQLTLLGPNLASDGAGLATYEIHTINPTNKMRAINLAAKFSYPDLFKAIEWDDTLVIGNWLPNAHFEGWTASTYPDYYRVTSATAAKTTTAGLFRGGLASAKVTATAGNGYMSISSDQYPMLLDLAGETVNFSCWAYPEAANDATIEIYTLRADGTAQTLTSTTTCPATKWSKLELDSQTINEDIQYIQFRFKVTTNAKYVYFDNAVVTGPAVSMTVLPFDFQAGEIAAIYEEIYGDEDAVTLGSSCVDGFFGWTTYSQNGVQYLRYPYPTASTNRLVLTGYAPLETLSADTDTMSISDPEAEFLLMMAAFKLYEMEAGLADTESRNNLKNEGNYWFSQYQFNRGQMGMIQPQSQQRIML